MDKREVLIIGRVPPPVGGVTTFILRTYYKLENEGVNVQLFPSSMKNNLNVFLKLMLGKYSDIIINTMSLPLFCVLFFSFNLSKVELVDHNHSRHFRADFSTYLKLFFIKKIKKVSLVDEHLLGNYPQVFRPLDILNPFLPPTSYEIDSAKAGQPKGMDSFLNLHDKICVLSAWRYNFENDIDIYGLERSLKLFIDIIHLYKNVGLVICIGDKNYNKERIQTLKELAQNRTNIFFWEDCTSSWSVFSEKSVYLRPTSTDGNSISIHEALYFNSLVLASDVVPRPNGCVSFDYNDDNDFKTKLISIIEDIYETNPTKHS